MGIGVANRACALIYSYIKNHNNGTWLLPVNVCPDVPLTFCLAGVKFEFVDIDSNTLCIDELMSLTKIQSRPEEYAGLLYVRTYGYLSDTSNFFSGCKRYNSDLRIVDDRCLCIPEREPDMFGSDMVVYSTGHCKPIDFGGGGFAYYADNEVYMVDETLSYNSTDEEALYKKAFSSNKKLEFIPNGWLLMSEYEQQYDDYINHIDSETNKRVQQRVELNTIYNRSLPLEWQLPDAYQNWRFNITVPSKLKDEILSSLFDNGLFASSHYNSVNKLFDDDTFERSENLHKSVINLFNDFYYSKDMAKKTCEVILKCAHSEWGGVILYKSINYNLLVA